ncbi:MULTISPECIES: hypothetical protein [Bartonella]|uniref:Uncharacterized protein n=2 Tax=Bartonella TaxID=773 RepID=A0A5B9CW58_9HYPH|nr:MULTISPECIES: hypothetical protein [Bartonella]QEE08676.1 hypothetical protein D1093_03260 [Bartonella kosoyi]QEE08856.1 hypothetical protein D1093_04240 [Bartonella kosoyi]CAK02318.1 hypothetical protein BT_2297 [Bartonella tribocorum CIP 105476]CDO49650.1 hypothetical protein BM1374166_02006 [Bartonella tribocorum]
MEIPLDILSSIISALIGSTISFLLSWCVRNADLKRAEKTRREDLCNVEKQFNHLEDQNKSLQKQATLAEKHVNFLLKTKEELDLGPSLLFKPNSPTPDEDDPNNGPISIIVRIINPTERIIQMDNIWIDKKCPFEFYKIKCCPPRLSQTIEIYPTSSKHINLINPKTKPQILFNGYTVAPFNIDPREEIKWEIFILPQNLDKAASPLFILEHTSSNHPQKTMKSIFWTHFVGCFSG